MRAYSASSEEALRARNLLKDWAGEGFITETQHERMEEEIVCELRCTNIFLRLVLFLFTLIIVGAAVALFFTIFLSQPSPQATGAWLLIFAAVSYTAAEVAVSEGRLYRYGIEEALAACSVAFLCVGMQAAFFSGPPYPPKPGGAHFLVPAAGALASLWMWRRFGLPYAFLAAMVFVVWLPGHWTPSPSARHLIVAAFYAAALITVAAVRSRHRFTYLDDGYSFVEAFLWLGIYLAMNLQLWFPSTLSEWSYGFRTTLGFSKPFYWATWVLIWCLPPTILARGLRRKDRLIIGFGAIVAILTLITNKPYLGWERYTWDPMLLGASLIALALFLDRWLAGGPDGVRHGFTAQRLSLKDRHWMNAASAAFGFLSPHSITLSPQAGSPGVRFGGGDSGGGGASSDF
jgi:hypothetical protein